MRVTQWALIACAALAGAAVAQGNEKPASAGSDKNKPATIQFNLAAPKPAAAESLPTAATLGELTYAGDNQAAAKPPPKPATRQVPKPTAKAAPKPAPTRKLVAAKPAKGAWISEWRRAYIAKHGHQPPVPAA